MAFGELPREFRLRDRQLLLATMAVLSLTSVINGDVYGQSSEHGVQQELSFFEYLAEMVETEEGWVDPLDMDGSFADVELQKVTDQDSAPDLPVEHSEEKP